jgi:predicted RNase H-like HicB family nuclease
MSFSDGPKTRTASNSQAETLDELNRNLREVIEMLLEDGEPEFDAEFIGTQKVSID